MVAGRRHSIAGGQIIHPHHGMDSPDFSTPPGEKTMSPQFEHSFVNSGNFELPKRSNSQKKRSKALSFGDLSRKGYSSRASSKSPIQKEDKEDNGQKGKESIELFIANDKSIELNKRPVLTQDVDEERQQAQHPAVEPETADCIMKTFSGELNFGLCHFVIFISEVYVNDVTQFIFDIEIVYLLVKSCVRMSESTRPN